MSRRKDKATETVRHGASREGSLGPTLIRRKYNFARAPRVVLVCRLRERMPYAREMIEGKK